MVLILNELQNVLHFQYLTLIFHGEKNKPLLSSRCLSIKDIQNFCNFYFWDSTTDGFTIMVFLSFSDIFWLFINY